jgi:hypothetical protein
MPGDPQQTARLRALHDDYVWEINAAVAEGREDLIATLCGQYLEDAVQILAEDLPASGPRCGRPDCGVCGSARPAPARRRRWGGR